MIAEIDLLYFFIQPSVFSKHVKVDDLQLPPEGVYVVWKWKWDICTDSENEELDTSKEVESEDKENLIEDTENDHEEVTHTVTFKCIGATKTPESQVALKTISELLASGNHVPVDLFPEPQNPYDSRASKPCLMVIGTPLGTLFVKSRNMYTVLLRKKKS